MKHTDCVYFLNLDCEKGMCAIKKVIIPIDGEGSDACADFKLGYSCGTCCNFSDADKYGIGNCSGFEQDNWTYAQNGAFCCPNYVQK